MKYSNDFSVIPQLAENRGWVFNYDDLSDFLNSGDPTANDQALTNGIAGLIGGDAGNVISQVGNDLSTGNFVKGITDTVAGIAKIIKGRAYTIGKYKLGEKFLDYVANQPVKDWEHVPDPVVNASIDYFSKAFGIPITTIEDLDAIDPVYEPGNNVQIYKTTRDPQYAQIPDANVQLAVDIKRQLPYSMSHWDFPTAYKRAGINVSSGSSSGGLGASLSGTGIKGSTLIFILIGVVVLLLMIYLVAKAAKK